MMNNCDDSLKVKQGFQSQDGGSNPTSSLQFNKKDWKVVPITSTEYYSWVMKKHYAHRMPIISYAFGLFNKDKEISGICTFGISANYNECKMWSPFKIIELNRLCLNDNIKNGASFFIAKCLKMLPPPMVIISYADIQFGHYGYIYQATNWIYTGLSGIADIYILKDGTERHLRHGNTGEIKKDLIERIEKRGGKARYYNFVGNKIEKMKMKSMLRFSSLPYPKGDNKRYDASYKPETQQILF